MKNFPMAALLWCLIWSSILVMFGLYLLIQGIGTRRINLQNLQDNLTTQKQSVTKFALPEKEAKAYILSIEALEKHHDLLEEARDLEFSIGWVAFGISFLTEVGLLWVLWRRKKYQVTGTVHH